MITTSYRTEDEPNGPGCWKVHEFCILTCEECGYQVEGYCGSHPKKIEDYPPGTSDYGYYSVYSMWVASSWMKKHVDSNHEMRPKIGAGSSLPR